VDWERPSEGDTALLVLISESTPREYVANLYDRGISYLTVGDNRIDLKVAVDWLARLSDRSTVLSSAGGTLNAALFRSGLVTDLHLVTIPALIGGAGTPSFLDSPEFQTDGTPVSLELVGLVQGRHGTTWSHYSVGAR
jgi:riboflavin biosynthesis pyrimidine reductase